MSNNQKEKIVKKKSRSQAELDAGKQALENLMTLMPQDLARQFVQKVLARTEEQLKKDNPVFLPDGVSEEELKDLPEELQQGLRSLANTSYNDLPELPPEEKQEMEETMLNEVCWGLVCSWINILHIARKDTPDTEPTPLTDDLLPKMTVPESFFQMSRLSNWQDCLGYAVIQNGLTKEQALQIYAGFVANVRPLIEAMPTSYSPVPEITICKDVNGYFLPAEEKLLASSTK